jgi:hypothetical protein
MLKGNCRFGKAYDLLSMHQKEIVHEIVIWVHQTGEEIPEFCAKLCVLVPLGPPRIMQGLGKKCMWFSILLWLSVCAPRKVLQVYEEGKLQIGKAYRLHCMHQKEIIHETSVDGMHIEEDFLLGMWAVHVFEARTWLL